MAKELKVGDKGRAVCSFCKGLVNITYKLRNVNLSEDSGTVKNVLAGVCDNCHKVVSIPSQEAYKIKAVIKGQVPW